MKQKKPMCFSPLYPVRKKTMIDKQELPEDMLLTDERILYICSGISVQSYDRDLHIGQAISRQTVAKVINKRLDNKELREKIDKLLRSEMVTIGTDTYTAKTGQMWAYDSERLSKRILALFDIEEIRAKLTELEKKLDDREADLITAKEEEREEIADWLDTQGAVWTSQNYAIIEAIRKGQALRGGK